MHDETELTVWSEHYAAWLDPARPLLEEANWKDAFAAGYPYPAPTYTPWAQVARPLSAGFYLRGDQPPFRAEHIEGDPTYRVLPENVRPDQLAIAHNHYPHAAATRFPRGETMGAPGDRRTQRRVLEAALEQLVTATTPAVVREFVPEGTG